MKDTPRPAAGGRYVLDPLTNRPVPAATEPPTETGAGAAAEPPDDPATPPSSPSPATEAPTASARRRRPQE